MKKPIQVAALFSAAVAFQVASLAQTDISPLEAKIREQASAVEQKVIAWRRDIHQHAELGDQENRTAKLVADHLQKLGMEVQTGVGRTGVVGVLKGCLLYTSPSPRD